MARVKTSTSHGSNVSLAQPASTDMAACSWYMPKRVSVSPI